MQLSFSTLGCPGWDLPTIAAQAEAYGFDGVELRIGGKQHVDTDMSAQARRETVALFKARQITIASLAGYTRFNSLDRSELEQQQRRMIENLELAYDMQAPYVRTFMGNDMEEGDIGYRAEYLHACGEAALANGRMVLIETHDSIRSGKRLAEIIKAADSRGIGALWDIYHTLAVGESPAETWAAMGSHIRHMHLKDSSGGKLCPVGEGEFPLRDIVRVLKANQFSGFLSYEWEKMWHPELAEPEVVFPAYVAYMRACAQSV